MRIARFRIGDRVQHGERVGDLLKPLAARFPDLEPVAGAEPVPVEAVELLTPTAPTKVVSLGPGQRGALPPDFALPERPTIWLKPPPSCLTHPGDPVPFPPGAQRLTHEVELAIVIGRTARRVDRTEAARCIAGYTVHNDLTCGDPRTDAATPLAWHWKSFDGCAPFGPEVVTDVRADELAGRAMRCRVNGELRTDTRCDLLFAPDDLVSWLSGIFTLYPGDLISTGAPGIGPLQPGDVCEVEIEGLGVLRNPIAASDAPHDAARCRIGYESLAP